MEKILKEEINKLRKIREIAKKEIAKLPDRNLRCTKNKGSYQYYVDGSYTAKEQKEFIAKVAKRQYLELLLSKINPIIHSLEKTETYYRQRTVDSFYDSLCEGRKVLFQPVAETLKQRAERFESQVYDPMDFREDDLTEYYTNKGERVRSKSEKLIADELYSKHIPYKYELPIKLNDRGKEIIYRPDFTVLNSRNGKIYILEHLGMLDKEEYLNSAIHKINTYEKNGFLLGDNLIIFHETSTEPFNTKVMKMYVDRYFL